MIINKVDTKDLAKDDALVTIDLEALGIDASHRDAIQKVVEEINKQGITIKIK